MEKTTFPLEERSIYQIYLESQETKTYVIPIYQRNYAWEEDEITALIKDVYDSFVKNKNDFYYIGTLVTYKRGDSVYEVIDGQQRLTTLMLLLRAFYARFGKMKDASTGASTLQAVADKLGEQLKEAKSVSFSSYSVPSVGVEPSLQAAMVTLPEQKISAPLKGNKGVYLIQVKQVVKPESIDLARERELLQRTNMSKAGYQVLSAIEAAADIEDNRSNFY